MRADIAPGGTFPNYELTDHTNTRRSLSELQGDDPLILVLARGHYCPKDHQQHLELAAAYPKIAVAYTQVVTISTDNIVDPASSVPASGPSGPSSPTPAASSRRTWASRSTPIPITTRWFRTRWCSSPGWRSTACTTAIGSGEGRRSTNCGAIFARRPVKSILIGT